jgi:hypothetical protein
MIVKSEAVIPLTPTSDQTGKEGYFVKPSSGKADLSDSAGDLILGVITEGAATTGKSSIALPNFGGTVKVKLNTTPGAVGLGSPLILHTNGTLKLDTGSGSRWRVARALEAGAAGELIEARLIEPTLLT